MNHKEVTEWRGIMGGLVAKQSADISHIKETVDEVKILVKEQNSRIRKNESAISKIQGIGSVLSLAFGGFIAWLFKSIK
jgi:hypothetical protein